LKQDENHEKHEIGAGFLVLSEAMRAVRRLKPDDTEGADSFVCFVYFVVNWIG
jgi:hypothetical protein